MTKGVDPQNPLFYALLRILLSHLVSAAVMVAVTLRTGESPRVFIYGFFINYLYRLLTLRALVAAHDSGTGWGRTLARTLSRPPAPGLQSAPVTVTDSRGTRPGRLGAYLLVLLVCGYFAFMEINVRDQAFVTPWRVVRDEVTAGFWAAIFWWVLDLVNRRWTIQFSEPHWVNFGYHSSETALIAITTLTGGIASAVMGTPWPYFIALVIFRAWFDAWYEAHTGR